MYFRLMGKLNARRNGLLAEEEKGFTLIELLVVVIIIGILAAIAIPVYLSVQKNARDSAVKSDIANFKTAIVAYESDKGALPTDTTGGDLADYGYTPPAATDGNYGSTGAAPSVSYTGTTTFCVEATSVDSDTFHASDSTGVTDGGCP